MLRAVHRLNGSRWSYNASDFAFHYIFNYGQLHVHSIIKNNVQKRKSFCIKFLVGLRPLKSFMILQMSISYVGYSCFYWSGSVELRIPVTLACTLEKRSSCFVNLALAHTWNIYLSSGNIWEKALKRRKTNQTNQLNKQKPKCIHFETAD